ncbi:MAG: ECF transporter S component [Anaerolineae bacterium]|nr:ECF transporter S component [Chloroflexota bacterium]
MKVRIGWTHLILLLATLVGLLAFLYPFFAGVVPQAGTLPSGAHPQSPLLALTVILLCLAAILATLATGAMNARMVAILGVLTAANAVLRAVPGPAGFAAVFTLPVLCGYAYGATFGFLLGALSLLASAMIGGGIGPWLPYQMMALGWVGMTSGWLPRMDRYPRLEALVLALWSLLWGFGFGAVMNIWFWPYIMQPQQSAMYWSPGAGLLETLKRYGVFYVTTSLWWDAARAIGNGLLTWLMAVPVLRLLRRFQRRFFFVWDRSIEQASTTDPSPPDVR